MPVLWRCWFCGRKGIRPVKNWVVGYWQLMPLPPTVSCFSKIQTGFTFLVPAHLGSPGQRAVKQLCVCVCVCVYLCVDNLSSFASLLFLLWSFSVKDIAHCRSKCLTVTVQIWFGGGQNNQFPLPFCCVSLAKILISTIECYFGLFLASSHVFCRIANEHVCVCVKLYQSINYLFSFILYTVSQHLNVLIFTATARIACEAGSV